MLPELATAAIENRNLVLEPFRLDALREWAGEPVRFPRVLHQGVVRLLAADLIGEEPVRESVLALRAELDELDSLMDAAEETAARLPHREKYLRINPDRSQREPRAHFSCGVFGST